MAARMPPAWQGPLKAPVTAAPMFLVLNPALVEYLILSLRLGKRF